MKKNVTTVSESDLLRQQSLISSLMDARIYPHAVRKVYLIETHISWVILAGRYAYKIKKAVYFGFLNFSSLSRRRHFCEEEIRLNARLAPQIYLDVVAIGGTPEAPALGNEPAIEYAVRMRRFSIANEMDRLIVRGKVMPSHIDRLAVLLGRFHQHQYVAKPDMPYGSAATVYEAALGNFEHFPASVQAVIGAERIDVLRDLTEQEFGACASQIEKRQAQGFVRECHGDLHLGNILVRSGEAIPFDGIEFNPHFRWIDVISDIAFPFMDLMHYGRADFAWRLLNGWLEQTGDYGGLTLLRFYAAYRAAVRAKVGAIRASQSKLSKRVLRRELSRAGQYLDLAANLLKRPQAALIITHGLPAAGKTLFAQMALERIGGIRIRSDVERKRLFGLSPLQSSRSQAGGSIYGVQATQQTYDRLLQLAKTLLGAHFPVIVDAAFLKHDEREQFRKLAGKMGAPFLIASVEANEATLHARIEQRQSAANDASEADHSVLTLLQAAQQALQENERADAVTFRNDGTPEMLQAEPGWGRIDALLR